MQRTHERTYRRRLADRRAEVTGARANLSAPAAQAVLSLDLGDALRDGKITPGDVAVATGLSPEQVRLVRNALRQAEVDRLRNEVWQPPTNYLGPDIEEARQRYLDGDHDVVDELLACFWPFLNDFFYVRKGQRFIIKWYHRLWLRRFLVCLFTGGKQMILSPPRHGKSKLLAHFIIWLIVKNPDIRVLWVSQTEPMAAQTVSYIKTQLETNDELRQTFLRPGQEWKATPWSTYEITVGTRTLVQVSPTLVAIGCNGTIQNRDADVIVCDDIEDWKRCLVDSRREKTREWFFHGVGSRDEEWTAWFCIGSRQHADDLWAHLEVTPGWEEGALVHSIHAPFFENPKRLGLVPDHLPSHCETDPLDTDAHHDCMLFPEVRSYGWWKAKEAAADANGLLWLAEMQYQNVRRSGGAQIYVTEMFADSYNTTRVLGLSGLPQTPEGLVVPTLVGGLDPSGTGYQAGFLWGMDFAGDRLWMVDNDNRRGGGEYEALELMKWWLDAYDCRWWVVEDNMYRKGMRRSRLISGWADRNGVVIEGHDTQGTNKWDPTFGLSCFVKLLRDDMVDLPAGDGASRAKSKLWERQLIAAADRDSRRRLTDVGMASWFPMKVWFRHRTGGAATAEVPDDGTFTDYAPDQEELMLTTYGAYTPYGGVA